MTDDAKGFFQALMDFSFSTFVTTKLIKFLYGVVIALAGLGAIVVLGAGLTQGALPAIISLIAAPILFLLWVLGGRVWLELIIVMFRIAENVQDIAKRKAEGTPS